MFVLELTYTAPVERVDALFDDHIAWLDEQYAAGVFLASGRKNPRDGGVILAAGVDRARIEEIAAADPFSTGGVCAYRITEFHATRTAEGIAAYQERPPSHSR
ncbi:YciI family protein [Streptomyces sp. NPDC001744]|uniref:YciI family protein n=1 Tax=Streptomyces sp. NPDC001744 TaxID=3364606 RepID=UPI003682E984